MKRRVPWAAIVGLSYVAMVLISVNFGLAAGGTERTQAAAGGDRIRLAFTYDPNSAGCFYEYRSKCVDERYRQCASFCGSTEACSGSLPCLTKIAKCTNECSSQKCMNASSCGLSASTLCRKRPVRPDPFPGCSY